MNIEKYLVLYKYLLSLFGIGDFRDLQEKLKDAPVGVDSDGRSHFVNILRSSFEGLRKDILPQETLLKYDENIQNYVRKINCKREPVSLKYFQYLAVLFTEIVLDNLKNRKIEFLYELNDFLETYKQEQDIDLIEKFSEEDLKKLAFWMATGSGKTLIMHINYHQFFHYNLFSPDSIILITPNEGLSKQHFEELQKSGIPSRLYSGSLNSGLKDEREVLVIEMTKLVEEKRGGGVTLPIEAFEGRNLIFVDEGHKGRKSEEQKWAKLRDKLAENGFAFEYSATFGQILSDKNQDILEKYAKSIVFDYSYKYFYLDGYGKDFFVLNVKGAGISEQEFAEAMFIANLLSFYEQLLVYEENVQLAKEYNIEKPLWIFVGATVTGKKEADEESDVIQIVELINRVIKDVDWTRGWAKRILNGETNLNDENGNNIFQNSFRYLRKKYSTGIDFEDLYRRVFGGKGGFKIYEIKNAPGEFGLKVGENNYFGVINIGDVSKFKKHLETKGIFVEEDVISGSLFDDIKKEGSSINILIGSRKFIEGWDTWRVSSMGLLNIGREQGPQIIQLFGRGVRLKGKGMSLKRSGDDFRIQLLEKLNIYGIKADYLSKFLEAIRKEEVEFETIEIPVKLQHEDKWKELYTLTKDDNKRFEEERVLRLELDDKIYFTIDLSPKISMYLAKERREEKSEIAGIESAEVKPEVEPLSFPEDKIDLLDWNKIWQEINEYKILKGYWNLVLNKEGLRNLLLSNRYKILTLPYAFDVKTREDVKRFEDIAILVIKKYIEKFYKKYASEFETEHLKYDTFSNQRRQLLLPFISERGESYVVQIDKQNKNLIDKIKALSGDLNKLLKEETEELPRVYFDSHLFLPILVKSNEIDSIKPEGLVESEKKFIVDLRDYLRKNKDEFKDCEIFLLRNFSKSGIGFRLQWSEFYPDFILWIKKGKRQVMVFIEPHGLKHSKGLDDEKIKFAGVNDSEGITIKRIEQEINKKENKDLVLEYFLISPTSYDELIKGEAKPTPKSEYERNHVLFLEDQDWPEKLFNHLIKHL